MLGNPIEGDDDFFDPNIGFKFERKLTTHTKRKARGT